MDTKIISTSLNKDRLGNSSASPANLVQMNSGQVKELAGAQPRPPIVSAEQTSEKAKEVTTPVDSFNQAEKIAERLNSQSLNKSHTLRFTVDEKLGKAIISVVDRETDEVIRQIPPETALQIAEALSEISAGQLLTERA